MSKMHKEIAMFMVRQADNDNMSDQDVVQVGNIICALVSVRARTYSGCPES